MKNNTAKLKSPHQPNLKKLLQLQLLNLEQLDGVAGGTPGPETSPRPEASSGPETSP